MYTLEFHPQLYWIDPHSQHLCCLPQKHFEYFSLPNRFSFCMKFYPKKINSHALPFPFLLYSFICFFHIHTNLALEGDPEEFSFFISSCILLSFFFSSFINFSIASSLSCSYFLNSLILSSVGTSFSKLSFS